jgi:hypothetical protein
MAKNLTPLPLSNEELDRLAEIVEQDIIRAQTFIARWLDPKYENLLLAKSQELAELEELEEESVGIQ